MNSQGDNKISKLSYRTEDLEHYHQLSQMCQMPNIWHIWHTNYHCSCFIICSKCFKNLKHVTVSSQIWDGTNSHAKIFSYLFNHGFSLSYSLRLSLSLNLIFSLLIWVFLSCRSRWSCQSRRRSRRSRRSRRGHSRPPQLPLHSRSLPLSSSSCLQPISPKATSSRWNRSCLKLPKVDLAADVSHLKLISPPELWVCLIWDGFWGLWMWWVMG